MNETREAIYEQLTGDASLMALATGGVHHGRAPQGSAFPTVIFAKLTGTPTHTFTGQLSREIWLVKGVSKGASAAPAEAIDAAIETALHDAALQIDDQTTLYLRRESDVDYQEYDGADQYNHVGGHYRLFTEPA